jgi:hypothetical protein
MIAGGTMAVVLDGEQLPAASEPPLEQVRPVNGRLLRVNGYLMMAAGAALTREPPDLARAQEGVALARCACRDPAPGEAGGALARVDAALAAAEQVVADGARNDGEANLAIGLAVAAAAVAATEPVEG